MFKCIPGNHVTKVGEKLTKKVLKTRSRTYTERTQTFRGKTIFDKGGTGSEVVTEVDSCSLHNL